MLRSVRECRSHAGAGGGVEIDKSLVILDEPDMIVSWVFSWETEDYTTRQRLDTEEGIGDERWLVNENP